MIRLILHTDFTETFAYNLLRGILEYSRAHEPWVVSRMPPSYRQIHGIMGVVNWAKRWHADAIIGQFDPHDNVDLFAQNGIVAVAQDFKSRFLSIPNITSNYIRTGQMAANYFLSKGYRNFAYFGYRGVVWSEERCLGFRDCVAEKGEECRFFEYQQQELGSWLFDEDRLLIDWVRSLPHPTALFACDDTQANKIMDACKVLGINIPREIAVLGVDNDEVACNLSDPHLSSVGLDITRGGYEAAELIERLVRDKDAVWEDIIIRPTTVYCRLSTDVFACEDAEILTVLQFIEQNLSHSISVDEILKRVPLSRRRLEVRFKQATGQPIYNYIMEIRMEHFARLLLEKSDPIPDLAMSIGLTDLRNLARQFRIKKGCSPSEYRKKHR